MCLWSGICPGIGIPLVYGCAIFYIYFLFSLDFIAHSDIANITLLSAAAELEAQFSPLFIQDYYSFSTHYLLQQTYSYSVSIDLRTDSLLSRETDSRRQHFTTYSTFQHYSSESGWKLPLSSTTSVDLRQTTINRAHKASSLHNQH